jgi:hypothetical protein
VRLKSIANGNLVSSREPKRRKVIFVTGLNSRRGVDAAIAEYRVYILDQDGHVSRAIGFVCPDDEAAKKYARQFVGGHDVELWHGDRKIATFDCEPE